MKLTLEDYIHKPRDTKRERELVRCLRELSESERLEFIDLLTEHHFFLGLEMAKKSLREKTSFVTLFEKFIDRSNASSIRWLLESLIPRLGFCRITGLLRNKLETNGRVVEMALYWLPSLCPKNNLKASQSLQILLDEAVARGITREPRSVSGSMNEGEPDTSVPSV